jgi:phospholipid/cholesterol/gamma-HCH transport system substrate-binding protein
MLRRQLERYGKWLIAIAILMAAGLGTAGVILVHQRLPLPWQKRYTVQVAFMNTAGVSPGLGQRVTVAGVTVGTILTSKLEDGHAVAKLEIDPKKLPRKRIHVDARAVLVPNTPLKDQQVDIDPGRAKTPSLPDGKKIEVANTSVPVDSDDLLNALDADTRDYFQILIGSTAEGLHGRGNDLRQLLRALGPTTRQIGELSAAVVGRRAQLRRLVTNLHVLSSATAAKDEQIGRVVDAADQTLQAISSQDSALSQSVALLPDTLARGRRTVRNTRDLAEQLVPTVRALNPAIRKLPGALVTVKPLLDEAVPVLRDKVRPLVREIQPLARDLTPAAVDLNAVTPSLTSAFRVLNYVAGELGYNPPGSNEGFIFWLAWFAHNGNSFLSTEDLNGSIWRGFGLIDCTSLVNQPQIVPLLQAVIGNLPVCP